MMISFTYDRQVLEIAKNDDHFLLVYPNTPAGRTAAKGAVREWLLNCELDLIATTRRCCARPSTPVAFACPLIAAPKEACSGAGEEHDRREGHKDERLLERGSRQ